MNLQLEIIVQFFRKIIQLNAAIILKSTNEYYRKMFSKSGSKMDLNPAMTTAQRGVVLVLRMRSRFLSVKWAII